MGRAVVARELRDGYVTGRNMAFVVQQMRLMMGSLVKTKMVK